MYRRMYYGARLQSANLYEREAVAAHWNRWLNFFSNALTSDSRDKFILETVHAPIPEDLNAVIQGLIEIVDACKERYESTVGLLT